MAERIRQLLPDFDGSDLDDQAEVIPPAGALRKIDPTVVDQTNNIITASEIRSAERSVLDSALVLVKNHNLHDACELILANLPFNDAISAFVDYIIPNFDEDVRPFYIYELTKLLQDLDQHAMAAQIVDGSGLDYKEVSSHIDAVSHIHGLQTDIKALDKILFKYTNAHFPQVLGYDTHPAWLRIQIINQLATGDPVYFDTTLKRYLHRFQNRVYIRALAKDQPRPMFDAITRAVFELREKSPDLDSKWWQAALGLVDATEDSGRFQKIWRKLKRCTPTPEVYEALLLQAIRLDLSYEITNIVTKGIYFLDPRLVSRALLSVAWSQRMSGDDSKALTTTKDVQTDLVVRVLNALPNNHVDGIMIRTLKSLTRNESIPSNVLWSILLGLKESDVTDLKPAVTAQLARAVATRPHIEQMRYMAMPATSSLSIFQLLRNNVHRMMVRRRTHEENVLQLESEADTQLMLAGMIMMSEKAHENAHDQALLVRVIHDLFHSWEPAQATAVVSNLQQYRGPTPEVTLATISMLVKLKNYTLAIQLLHGLDPKTVPEPLIHDLLLRICVDYPDISLTLTNWLINKANVTVPPMILRKMIISICRTHKLSDHQIIRRVKSLLKILRSQNKGAGPRAAAAIVDGLLRRAQEKGAGSRKRLQWALDLSRHEQVPSAKVREWLLHVQQMRVDGKGYFARFR